MEYGYGYGAILNYLACGDCVHFRKDCKESINPHCHAGLKCINGKNYKSNFELDKIK